MRLLSRTPPHLFIIRSTILSAALGVVVVVRPQRRVLVVSYLGTIFRAPFRYIWTDVFRQ